MTAVVAAPLPHSRPSSGRKACWCCPYGYHIDLDFVRYCEAVACSQLLPKPLGARRRPTTSSIHTLLGLPSPDNEINETEDGSDVLEKAVQDFELTLRRTTHRRGERRPNTGDGDPWTDGIHSKDSLAPDKPGLAPHRTPPGVQSQPIAPQAPVSSQYSAPRPSSPPPPLQGTLLPLQGLPLPLQGPPLPQPGPSLPLQGLPLPLQGPPLPFQGPSVPLQGPPLPLQGPSLPLQGLPLPLQDPPLPPRSPPPCSVCSCSNNSSPTTPLHVVRQQMASSLAEIRRLEEEVRMIPSLKLEISALKAERSSLMQRLEDIQVSTKSEREKSTKLVTQEKPPVRKRNISVGTSLVTRDVGVCHKLPLVFSRGTETDKLDVLDAPVPPLPPPTVHLEKQLSSSSVQTDNFYEVSLQNRANQTDLKMDTIYSSADLERNIDKAIKVYEKTFHHLLHPKKVITVAAGVQVDTRASVQLCDTGAQVRPPTRDFGAVSKPKCFNLGVQHRVPCRDVAVSHQTTLTQCSKCSVKKCDFGMNFPFDRKEYRSIWEAGRSKSFDTHKRRVKSVAVGPDKSTTSSKSTDTNQLNQRREVGVITSKNKMVDTAVDPIIIPSPIGRTSVSPTGSKIPRPVTLPVSPRVLQRQNTYSISHHKPESFTSETFEGDVASEGACALFEGDSSLHDEEPFFRTITSSDSPRIRREPSKEMKGALKVLNDGLIFIKGGNPSIHVKNAIEVVQQEWFKVCGNASSDPIEVEDYLDYFEELSSELLHFIVNMVDATGNTAMHYVVSHGNFDVVSVLLDSKVCDVNKRNAAGYTCTMLVSLAKVNSLPDRQVVRRLFQLADVNIRSIKYGHTALMLAVSHGRMDMVEMLLDCGADINIQDGEGSTALMCAAEHGHLDIVKFFLSHPDCDLTITDNEGNTALNIAVEAGHKDIGVILYAQQHFSRGSSPYSSFKARKPASSTPVKGSTLSSTSPVPKK